MKLKMLFDNLEEVLCGMFLLVMISLVIINVFLRYFTYYSLYWAEEVATICFVWAVFIGASATYKRKMDIGIQFLVDKASLEVQKGVKVITAGLLLMLNLYILYISIVFTTIALNKPTAVLGISSAVFNSALIVSFAFISWHAIRFFIESFNLFFQTNNEDS